MCKHCATCVAYASHNTSNMLAHLRRHHPRVSIDSTWRRESGRKEQLTLPAAFKQPLSEKSDGAKVITKASGEFTAKDIQPNAMVDDAGFQHLIKVLEPCYNIPSRQHFSNTQNCQRNVQQRHHISVTSKPTL